MKMNFWEVANPISQFWVTGYNVKVFAIITVENLVKRYHKAQRNAVDDISFTVEKGEFFALLGPNGAGKTTAISILTTTLSKTSGQVSIAGYDIDKNTSQIRRELGIIFQKPSIDDNLTAEENVRFHVFLYNLYPFRPTYGLMSAEYKERIAELSHVLGFSNELFNPIKTFSGGMKRKLEIVRSLMHKPKILFLDEPTSGLDPVSRANLWSYLKHVRESENTTIFLTTHYLEEAEEADRLCIINEGKIVSYGTPTEIKGDLQQSTVTLSSDQFDALCGELTNKGIQFVVEGGDVIIHPQSNEIAPMIQLIVTPLTKLDMHNPTIEDAYLKIIGQSVNKESETK